MTLKRHIDQNDQDKLKFIEGAGQVKADIQLTDDGIHRCHLRMPMHAIERIDVLISKKMGMNRTSWILQAIQEKLERDFN